MDREAALKALGLSSRAKPDEIETAYRKRADALKHKVLTAAEPGTIARHREALRALVRQRDAAFGKERPPPAKLGVSVRQLVATLRDTKVSDLDRDTARRFFGLAPAASDTDVLAAYDLRKRALVRRYVRAAQAAEVSAIRRAQGKLRTLRNFALS